MKTIQRACSVAIVLLCAGCGSDQEAAAPEPMAPTDTFAGDQVRALERARGVEATTMQSKESIDRALDESEGAAQQ